MDIISTFNLTFILILTLLDCFSIFNKAFIFLTEVLLIYFNFKSCASLWFRFSKWILMSSWNYYAQFKIKNIQSIGQYVHDYNLIDEGNTNTIISIQIINNTFYVQLMNFNSPNRKYIYWGLSTYLYSIKGYILLILHAGK